MGKALLTAAMTLRILVKQASKKQKAWPAAVDRSGTLALLLHHILSMRNL
jgi:hypothetical protein